MIRRLTTPPTTAIRTTRTAAAALLLATGLGLQGCSSLSEMLAGNKVDYRTAAAKAPPVAVPPDLTQLQNDPRYRPVAGAVVSANALQSERGAPAGAAAPSTTTAATTTTGPQTGSQQTVAVNADGALRIERIGNQRWLISQQTPEQLWPQLRTFWQQSGFTLAVDKPEVGVMETEWHENRSRIPRDFVRQTIGRVFENLYDSGERDRYRMRVERGPKGTEVYISHRGMIETVVDKRQPDETRWQARPNDPALEAEMLAQMLVALRNEGNVPTRSADNAPAKAAADAQVNAANAVKTPERARILEGRPAATLQIDDDLDRAWRRVGLALDRGGFTVEDRDRGQGVYFVRYVDPKLAGQEEPGMFAKMFGAKRAELTGTRYQVRVAKDTAAASLVSIQDDKGAPQNSEGARTIVQLLLAELR